MSSCGFWAEVHVTTAAFGWSSRLNEVACRAACGIASKSKPNEAHEGYEGRACPGENLGLSQSLAPPLEGFLHPTWFVEAVACLIYRSQRSVPGVPIANRMCLSFTNSTPGSCLIAPRH